MDKVSLIVSGLEYKIKKLVDLQSQTSTENNKLKLEINNLKTIIENQKVIISKIEDKNKVQKIARVLENLPAGRQDGKDNKAKLRINELVREIDKCIALLNK